jgi:hypothetical protein
VIAVQEFDLELVFSGARRVVRFDDDTYHSGSTVQRVDFIAEYDAHHLFVEVKDPDNPSASNVAAFEAKMKSGKLIQSLSGKFRDTLFFRSVQGNFDKNVIYIVLIGMAKLDSALLVAKQDELRRSIPMRHADWKRDCATSCIILNIEQWQKQFGAHSLRRISEGAPT